MMRAGKGESGSATGLLGSIEIFSDLRPAELAGVAGLMGRRSHAKGEVLFREGDPGDELYVVVSGSVAITVALADGGELPLSTMAAGNFFGEMSIVERAPRSATCRAAEDCELLSLHADDFHDLISRRPRAAAKILNRMLKIATGRLAHTGAFLSQMVQFGETARKRAVTDEATGMFNRRFLEDSLEGLFTRSKLEAKPLAMVMFDLDRFGDLNKKYGQAFGDRVILDAAAAFKKTFLPGDILVRYGGDEFIFLLPDTETPAALERCGRVCRAIRGLKFEGREELTVTCSMGVAVHPAHAQTLAELKEKADKALYNAKEAGRDRAVAAG